MTAYYNEIDPKAAAWLRELIRAGHIAPGDVDERSIEDVTPEELMGYTQCHFFAGIGVWSYALRQSGWPDNRPVWTGSCPCQPFSAAGKGAGFDDERHLWPAFHWLIQQCQPVTVFGEQVAGKNGLAWLDLVQSDLERTGYSCGHSVTAACGFGAPHQRKRLYWVADSGHGPKGGDAGNVCGTEGAKQEPGRRRSTYSGTASGVADSTSVDDGGLRLTGSEDLQGGTFGTGIASGSQDGVMADNEGGGLGSGPGLRDREQARQWGDEPADDCGDGQLADSAGSQCGRGASDAEGLLFHGAAVEWDKGERDAAGGSEVHNPGPTNGQWRDADWLFCRDGKWRPVEPGTFPLAHGAPARVGRLRGYGNALCAAQAEAFISAFLV